MIGIISTYVIAFVQAGSSVFPSIEKWSLGRAMLVHFAAIYSVYTVAYLINSWIPFKIEVFVAYTAIFVAVFLASWLSALLIVKKTSKKFNSKLK